MISINDIRERLFALSDLKYKDFSASLMPTVDKETVIGVKAPKLRSLAKEIWLSGDAKVVFESLPHKFYEENNLHAFLIEKITDFEDCIAEIERFLPYIDNWATCDSMNPKVLGKESDRLLPYIKLWLNSKHTYTVRYAIGLLMRHYLDGNFKSEFLDTVSTIRSNEYYVNMMVAWYFATALAKKYEAALRYIESSSLAPWVHNKAIQKAIESYRISPEKKNYLRTLKIK